jgi:hypothetical protein
MKFNDKFDQQFHVTAQRSVKRYSKDEIRIENSIREEIARSQNLENAKVFYNGDSPDMRAVKRIRCDRNIVLVVH